MVIYIYKHLDIITFVMEKNEYYNYVNEKEN